MGNFCDIEMCVCVFVCVCARACVRVCAREQIFPSIVYLLYHCVCVGMRLSRMTMLGFFRLIICGAEGASREVSGGLLRCQYDDHHAIWISS